MNSRSPKIYYFTGTGNSLVAARDIAERIGGILVPIASFFRKSSGAPIEPQTDVIGIVFPVYYGNLPVLVQRFLYRLKNPAGAYIFAVATYGGAAGDSFADTTRILASKGGRLSARFGVHMPQNAFYKSWEKPEKVYKKWERKCNSICDRIGRRKGGMPAGNFLYNMMLAPFGLLFTGATKKYLAKIGGSSAELPLDRLIYSADNSYSVTEECTACGVCVRVCPADNIEMTGAGPVWLHHCENCLACYHWCPQKAVRGGIAGKGYYYRHPDVTVSDIEGQKGCS